MRFGTQEFENWTQHILCKSVESPVVLKISPILFDSLENLRINESVKLNIE